MEINSEKFSGPLGLLLSLIESEEMDITEISLAKIADDYVSYIRESDDIGAEEMADFLVIAAKLLYIKSKALLPYLYHEEEEDESDNLERQLKMYKEFINASLKVKELISLNRRLYLPPLGKNKRFQSNLPSFRPPKKLNKEILRNCYGILLDILSAELKKREEDRLPSESLEPKISIEEKISIIRNMLGEKIKLSFSAMLRSAANKTEVIVSFLAVLELAKQKELRFEQSELFSEIMIKDFTEELESDNYNSDEEFVNEDSLDNNE